MNSKPEEDTAPFTVPDSRSSPVPYEKRFRPDADACDIIFDGDAAEFSQLVKFHLSFLKGAGFLDSKDLAGVVLSYAIQLNPTPGLG